MKRIGIDEVYLLSAIADKINFQVPKTTKIIKVKNDEGQLEDKEVSKGDMELGIEIGVTIFKRLHTCKDEVNELLSAVVDKSIKEMSLFEIKDAIIGILKQEGVVDFFTSAPNEQEKNL